MSVPEAVETPWQRLSARMIWVDLAQSVLALLPAVIAIWVVGADPGQGGIWALVALAVVGVFGAITDALRWVFTRYRINESHVELKTGVLFRAHRSIQRERIRSVDAEAKLRHRVAGLRVLKIGAGQQNADGDSALTLDALSAPHARMLQAHLHPSAAASRESTSPEGEANGTPVAEPTTSPRVLARFDPRWVVFNMFNVWAYALALGLGWGGFWLLGGVGIDVGGFVVGLLDWESLGWGWTIAIGFAVVSVFGAIGLGVNYFFEYWNFELARVPSKDGTLLRTRKGLLTTREVNRDEKRTKGVHVSQPLLWRWMGASDASVITTGLDVWSLSDPTAILPRGPVRVARRVAAEVLDSDQRPLEAPLAPHPRAALRRRLWWATGVTAAVGGVLGWLALTDVVPAAAVWSTLALWPLALGAAVIAYRALGHAIVGSYLVTRSGLLNRVTTVLQRSAVSTIVIRESPLQRRLKLRTVTAMTAAGYCAYDTPDLERDASVRFALAAAPGVLDRFVVREGCRTHGRPPGREYAD